MSEITVIPQGGLANRMRAIASAISLARDAKMACKAVWQPDALLNARFGQLFRTDAMPIEVSHCSPLKFALTYSSPRRRNLYLSTIFQHCRYNARWSSWKLPLLTDIGNHAGETGWLTTHAKDAGNVIVFAGTEFYPIADGMMAELFRPTDEIVGMIKGITERFNGHTVGVHIRRTDNAEAIKHSPTELFIEEMQHLVDADSDTLFYLASDSHEVKDRLRGVFGDRVITLDISTARNDNGAIRMALAEMYALGATKEIIGSHYSSYSEMAARLSGAPLRQLYV